MLICPHTGRSDIGKTVVPGVGSFLGTGGLGSFGLFLDHVGSYVLIRLVKLSEIQREVEEIIGNSELDGAAFRREMEAPVGFRDDDEAPAGVVDLKKLAGGDGDLTPRGDDRNDVWKHAVRRPAKAADEASDAGSTTLRPPDLRVCYIDMDDTGTRYKEWRKVILESKTLTYADVPLEGLLSALNWCRRTHTHTHIALVGTRDFGLPSLLGPRASTLQTGSTTSFRHSSMRCTTAGPTTNTTSAARSASR